MTNDLTFQSIHCRLESAPKALAFHPTKPLLFVSDQAKNIDIFDLESGQQIRRISHSSTVFAIGFYENELYGFDEDKNIARWDLNTFEFKGMKYVDRLYHGLTKTPEGEWVPDGMGTITQAHFVPKKPLLIVGVDIRAFWCDYTMLVQINIQEAAIVKEYDFDRRDVVLMDTVALSRDGTKVCAGGLDFTVLTDGDYSSSYEMIVQWKLDTGEKICSFECDEVSSHHSHLAFMQTYSPAGDRLLVLLKKTYFTSFSLWKTDGENLILEEKNESKDFFFWEPDQINLIEELAMEEDLDVSALEWSPCSDWIAFGKPCGGIALWDINQRTTIFEEKAFESPVQCVKFSIDGSYLAAFSKDLEVKIYKLPKFDASMINDHCLRVAKELDCTYFMVQKGPKSPSFVILVVDGNNQRATFDFETGNTIISSPNFQKSAEALRLINQHRAEFMDYWKLQPFLPQTILKPLRPHDYGKRGWPSIATLEDFIEDYGSPPYSKGIFVCFKLFPHTTLVSWIYQDMDVAEDWCCETFGPPLIIDHIQEDLLRETAEIFGSPINIEHIKYETSITCREKRSTNASGKWATLWLGKTDYDFGYQQFFFKDPADKEAFENFLKTELEIT